MHFLYVGLSALVISVAGWAAHAQTVPGQEAAAFEEARALWLQGEDIAALSALAAASREGNVAAQMLLSRIADTPWMHDHVTQDLPRRERIALLRRDEGLSGKDWMETAAEASPLAEAFWRVQNPPVGQFLEVSLAEIFLDHGEDMAAFRVLNRYGITDPASAISYAYPLAERVEGAGPFVLSQVIAGLHQQGQPIPWPSFVQSSADAQVFFDALRQVGNALSYAGPFGAGIVLGEDATQAQVTGWLDSAPELAPLRRVCAATCPERQEACRVAAARRLPFPHPFASPLQSIVSDAAYWDSARFDGDVARLLARVDWPGCEG